MKNIDLMNDVGAPALVTVINIAARNTSTMIGTWPAADVATYAMAFGGYLAAYMGWGGKYGGFVKNLAIASAPLAFEKLYNKVKSGSVVARAGVSRPMMNRVSRYPSPASEGFNGVRLV